MMSDFKNSKEFILLKQSYLVLPLGVGVFDTQGNLILCNSKYDSMLEIINRDGSCNLLSSPEISDEVKQHLKEDDDYKFRMTFAADGSVISDIMIGETVESHVTKIYFDNELIGFVAVVENITSKLRDEMNLHTKNNELNEMVYQRNLILSNINSGLVYLTPDYRVLWKSLKKIYKEKDEKMYRVGSHCFEHFGLTEPCIDCPVTWAHTEGQAKERTFHDPNGTSLDVFVTPVRNDEDVIEGYLMRLDDVTKRENMINELHAAKEKAEKSEKAESAFLANMSHEIRTPMNAIVGFNDLLNGPGSENLEPEEKEEFQKIISDNVELMTTLVNDVFELSRLDAGIYKAKFNDTELISLCKTCIMSVKSRAEEGVVLKLDDPTGLDSIIINTDGQRLVQLLTNLLTNACKYTEEGSITLAIERMYIKNVDSIRFSVTDTGSGIPEGKEKVIFNRFAKLDDLKQGSGLGLNICTHIANMLQGKVYVDETYKQGARFIFDMPVHRTDAYLEADKLSVNNVL